MQMIMLLKTLANFSTRIAAAIGFVMVFGGGFTGVSQAADVISRFELLHITNRSQSESAIWLFAQNDSAQTRRVHSLKGYTESEARAKL